MSELLDLARAVEREARSLGADEVSATATKGHHTHIARRDGRIEQATEATTRGIAVSLLVEGRSSSHSTSDLRPEALTTFLTRAIEATRYLEPDPDRALAPAELCGRGVSEEALDQLDPAWGDRTAEQRARHAEHLEQVVAALGVEDAISAAVHVADGASEAARVMSNGFEDSSRGAWFMVAGDMTVKDADGRRPEAAAYYASRYLTDLPSDDKVAAELALRVRERRNARPIESGTYPLILLNRATGRILGALGAPLSAGSIHEGRSCLAGKKGQRIGSPVFTLIDDPTIPRGLASRPWDGDGLRARPLTVVREGVLENYYVNVYYGRKLGWEPTTGSRSNWVVPPGEQSWQALARQFPKAILVDGFLGGNSNPVTGDFSFGIRGMLLEHGEKTRSLSEMNVSGNLLGIFDRLTAVADDPYPYSALQSPTLIFEDVQFSGV